MSKIQVTATSKKLSDAGIKEVSVDYDFGDNLQEAVEKFGEDVVYSNYKSKAVIFVQGALRRWAEALLDKGEEVTAEKLQEKADNLVIGVVQRSKASKVDKGKKLIDEMTPEELAEYKRLLDEKIAAAAANA